ncbi:serine protease thp 1 [Phycomyces blakesleeanus]|uniref:Peptidase S8/S53 domain-containing protein n=2 Tax=Phycomyces blakesleeanus TaxID=4837 RepID=A0A167R469_PHYB8|nr:hypothetical protein PHYBLDRAFT_105457 [Phycomyces blakesleeanus NRRL 1555(-)]OAD80807.1 hypothetical protein PHYBLDRAFT_105457 [Phycomyces blakesleeanus NRRL 1555(-)]|eukprot:XP_018298847.1 hypothetical protein PHYBLDRAFT_105457 [Phycomyces blakesleeanus NRRL 1555(-)]
MANRETHSITDQDFSSQTPLLSKHPSEAASVTLDPIRQFLSIPDSYLIIFKQGTKQETVLSHHDEIEEIQRIEKFLTSRDLDFGIIHKYEIGNFSGYSGKFSSSVIRIIQTYEEVDYVEQDKYIEAASIQNRAPWGLARISHREVLNSVTFDKYMYEKNGGKYVTVYVLDTGIYDKHNDFDGRASFGVNLLNCSSEEDTNGHGTHSAGIIGGKVYGVAKRAKLVSVKILDEDGIGTLSNAIAGINWVFKNHAFGVRRSLSRKWIYKGAVATLNFITTKSTALNQAVDEGAYKGISIVVPAGNNMGNACNYSPSSAKNCITVSASTYYDHDTRPSNFGECVDIYAPGQNILSAWNTDMNSKKVLSGTSTAASHVAGLAAYYTSMVEGQSTPEYIKRKIIYTSTPDIIRVDLVSRSYFEPLAFYETNT